MVKKKYICLIIFTLLFFGTSCANRISHKIPGSTNSFLTEIFVSTEKTSKTKTELSNTTPKKEETVISFKLCYIAREVFYEFIRNPKQSLLEQEGNETDTYMFSESIDYPGKIRYEILSSDTVEIYDNHDEINIPYLHITINNILLNFVGNKNEIGKYLKQNGITGNIESIIILAVYDYSPRTIWVEVDQENYFITIDEMYNINEETNVYRIYNHSEYYEKFKVKDGKLIVNGKDITSDNYIKIHYRYAEFPLVETIKALGAKVEWQSKTTALVTYNNKKYIIDTIEYSFAEIGSIDNIIETPPGGYSFYQVIGDDFILDSDLMKYVVNYMGANINIDYENLTITIN